MRDYRCIKHPKRDDWIKVIKDSDSHTGYRCSMADNGWAAAIGSAQMIVDEWPNVYRLADCDECKHKLACLVDPYNKKKFESI